MEGLLGIMWAEVNLKEHDLESFGRLVHSQELECLDDAVEDAWRFVKSMQHGLAAWEPFLLFYIRSVNTILEFHSDLFWRVAKKKDFKPDVAVTHLEAMRLGWRDGFACGAVELAVQGYVVVGLPMPFQNALSTTQPAVLLLHPQPPASSDAAENGIILAGEWG